MFENIYAHTQTNDPDKRHWQSLKDHLEGTAKLAEEFASKFGSGSWGRATGMLHDLGKAHKEFQKYLEESNKNPDEKIHCRINHSDVGAIFSEWNLDNTFIGRTLAYIIAGHHAGLPDFSTDDGNARASLQARTNRKNLRIFKELENSFDQIVKQINVETLEATSLPWSYDKIYHFWVRFLFSSLIDADYLNTESFSSKDTNSKRGNFEDIPVLKQRFDRYMQQYQRNPNPSSDDPVATLQIVRDQVLKSCRGVGRSKEDGIFTLTVPTGGGKTLSSMAFALEKAISLNKERIIYVIPYTSIIEQTGREFTKVFNDENNSNVVEHHCNFDFGEDDDKLPLKEKERLLKLKLATDNWDAPIIVTTNVQFFESLFSAKTNRCRKLHNIVNSVVIFDEIQTLPTEYLAPCIEALNCLSTNFGVVSVLCTATQPAFEYIDKIKCKYAYQALQKTNPIIPKELEATLFQNLKRVEYHFDLLNQKNNGVRDWDELAEELSSQDNSEVLCIVNTRRDCYDLYSKIKKQIEEKGDSSNSKTFCLSTLMCAQHRSDVIKEIKNILTANRTQKEKTQLRVVATQLVEAGVDIDFPVVYRALAGLDSIVQAAGRCNREGKLRFGKVIVFNPPNIPSIFQKQVDITRELLMENPNLDLNAPSTFEEYFKRYYKIKNKLDVKNIINSLTVAFDEAEPDVPFRTTGNNFQIIEDWKQPVVVPYGDGIKYIDQLEKTEDIKKIMRKIQRFTVSLSQEEIKQKADALIIKQILPGLFTLPEKKYYDDALGFNIFTNSKPFISTN